MSESLRTRIDHLGDRRAAAYAPPAAAAGMTAAGLG